MPRRLHVTIKNSRGLKVGTLTLTPEGQNVRVSLKVKNLEPGFHGFHLHQRHFENTDFSQAGFHIDPEQEHPQHKGDFPSVLVNNNGQGELSFLTDRFTIEELLDEDGTSVIIHKQNDNYSNIPQRYGGPDKETLIAGDPGQGVVGGNLA